MPLDDTAGGPEYELFQSAGVPSVIVKSLQDAFGYRLVILAGTLSNGALSEDDFKRLHEYVASGGNVIVEAATAFQAKDLVGWTDAIESNKRQSLKFCDGCGVAEQIDTKGERYVALDTFADDAPMGTVGYKLADEGDDLIAPATFDDGTAAVVMHAYGTGHVLAIGARILDLVTRHWEGTRFSPRRTYANVAGSDADVWLLGLRSLYRQLEPGGLTLSTAPDGTRAALIPTISANWSGGVVNASRYVAALAKVGAPATVFIPTHYTEDWLDSAFFPFPGTDPNADQVATTRSILAMEANGAEIGSHSVAHSPVFNKLPMGKGDETIKSYKPFVESKTVTEGATVTGELRVSRQLLTQFASPKLSDADALARVTSFRAGYLLSPRGLAEALDATGYRYDSTSTQGFVEGAMPFHMPRLDDKGFSNVFEFPITIEDEAKPAFASRIDDAAGVIAQNAANGVPSVVLVHPNADKAKVSAYQKLIQLSQKVTAEKVPASGDADVDPLWTGTLRDFGAFWSERDGLALATYADAASCAGGTVFVVYNRGCVDAEGQAIDVGDDQLVSANVNGETIAVNAYRKLPLPTIAAGDAIKGQLCPAATGPDLASGWKLIGRTVDAQLGRLLGRQRGAKRRRQPERLRRHDRPRRWADHLHGDRQERRPLPRRPDQHRVRRHRDRWLRRDLGRREPGRPDPGVLERHPDRHGRARALSPSGRAYSSSGVSSAGGPGCGPGTAVRSSSIASRCARRLHCSLRRDIASEKCSSTARKKPAATTKRAFEGVRMPMMSASLLEQRAPRGEHEEAASGREPEQRVALLQPPSPHELEHEQQQQRPSRSARRG